MRQCYADHGNLLGRGLSHGRQRLSRPVHRAGVGDSQLAPLLKIERSDRAGGVPQVAELREQGDALRV